MNFQSRFFHVILLSCLLNKQITTFLGNNSINTSDIAKRPKQSKESATNKMKKKNQNKCAYIRINACVTPKCVLQIKECVHKNKSYSLKCRGIPER